MAHLALAVSDQERSRRFYETYFGFDAGPVAEDGTLMLEDGHGFSLALQETDEPVRLPGFFHFGFGGARTADEVRAFRDRLASDGVAIVEWWDEPDYVSVKCRDPDGYVVEAAWEPERAQPL
jgi:catechol 2,3-dioxygenase-like lactoylglutathione lyase family enzyme